MRANLRYIAVDFETDPIPFFDRKKKCDFRGHPRLFQPQTMSLSDGLTAKALHGPTPSDLPPAEEYVFHNAAFDVLVAFVGGLLNPFRLQPPVKIHCTLLMAKLLNNTDPAGLKALAKRLLGAETISYKEARSAGGAVFDSYAANDALWTSQLFPILADAVRAAGLWTLYDEVERPFILIELECQLNGFFIDRAALASVEHAMKQDLAKAEEHLNACA